MTVDRVWLKRQTKGELDDTLLIEGVTGAANVYKHRGQPQSVGSGGNKPNVRHRTLSIIDYRLARRRSMAEGDGRVVTWQGIRQ